MGSGCPIEFQPDPRTEVATELASLSGGPRALLARAIELAFHNVPLACHLADYVMEAAPDDSAIVEAVAALYTERGARESSLMATNLYRSAAAGALSRFPSS
ncbi:alkyl sulfatase dimerization domain-containing protein [Streptomyces alfalfae]|uniref:alkyl sulfatase dimerization domain-containing protein n=1 Tax=Streptomyces alfalfae TaxID=1642299 RepID=UPI001BA55EF8|nr:alkyl sulfatase dimerization domain-containing protein [Streptomyces alfalfae]QUI34690.1 hypothetical protein H9W91_30405 [Streptomyces alfalfae]